MTYEQDRDDLARHEAETVAHLSFNYALFDDAETALLGCVYIDPPEKQGADAEISWWVVDSRAGTGLESALDALVPQWIATTWPFTQPRYVGRDLSWDEWIALPPSSPQPPDARRPPQPPGSRSCQPGIGDLRQMSHPVGGRTGRSPPVQPMNDYACSGTGMPCWCF
jgi:hypothetical protein